jgi:hypothetical protein
MRFFAATHKSSKPSFAQFLSLRTWSGAVKAFESWRISAGADGARPATY